MKGLQKWDKCNVWTGERKQIDGGETSLSPLVHSRRMLVQVSTCKARGWLERVAACVCVEEYIGDETFCLLRLGCGCRLSS
jgi:hypothetical protein